jgi:uncharacterized protein
MTRLLPSLLRPLHSDEYLPVRPHRALARATDAVARTVPQLAGAVALDAPTYAHDRRATALALLEIDGAHGGGFYAIDPGAALNRDAAAAAFRARGPVVDVQTHLVRPSRHTTASAAALMGFLRMVEPERWSDPIDPDHLSAPAWASCVFAGSETSVALLTSPPGLEGDAVIDNADIAAAREVVDRYAGTGRVLTHTIVHPNAGPDELDRMATWSTELRPAGWKVYTLWDPPGGPTGGWYLDDDLGAAFLDRVREVGPRIVCAHKGLAGPIPSLAPAAASPRDIGPAAVAYPDIDFVVYHSGYDIDARHEEGAHDADPQRGVSRLVSSLADAGVRPGANVWAELGSTWSLVLRRPLEAAHVLGKLLLAVGEDRILWGTDSVWYGPPQPLIDAFRAFTIPERVREAHGYPELTPEVKQKILGGNASALYGIGPRRRPDDGLVWIEEARRHLAARLS